MEGCFYENGLRFQCQRCSGCCRGEPGYVFLHDEDIDRLSGRLGTDRETFIEGRCRVIDMGIERLYSLKEKKNNDCEFWDAGCSLYLDRPVQCSSYPFWAQIVESEASWQAEAGVCPGIGKGRLFSKAEIEEKLFSRRRARPAGPIDSAGH